MKKLLIGLIRFYKVFISPLIFRLFGGGCRFYPTCSDYSIQAIEKYGVIKGLFLSFRRIISCHPFSKKPHLDLLK
jgi:putative membrane protein insertion efficiency factor